MNSIGPRMTPICEPEKFAKLKDDYKKEEPNLKPIEEETLKNIGNEKGRPTGWPNIPFGD